MGFLQITCLVLAAACAVTAETADDGTCGIYADSLAHPVYCNKYYNLNLHTCPEGLYFNAQTKQCDLPQNTKCGQATTTEEVPTEDGGTSRPTTQVTTYTPDTTSTTTASTTTPTTTTTTPTTTASTTTPTTTKEPTTPPYTTTPTTTTASTTRPTTTTVPTTTPITTASTTTPTTTPPTTTPTTTKVPTTTPSTTASTTTPTTTREPTTTPTTTTITSTIWTTAGTTINPTGSTPTFTTSEGTTIETPQNGCPAVDDASNRVRYAHESNCQYYYLCTNGNKVLYTCTSSNHFNPIKKTCRPANEAGCDRCPDAAVEGEDVRLPHEAICEYYYKCEGAGQTLYSCVAGQQFSRADRICVGQEEAKCNLEDD